ncbi:Fungal hydrophobin [Mycena venus]|uniref:Hydrophobin n=1 Tax=Mycena venus TaxID=2733690 RepID=A0A8H6YJ07_9AGAR|nr:Fungal hydrophobin [Mycena venus]
MFSKLSVVVVSALATLAVAIPHGSAPSSSSCCNSIMNKEEFIASGYYKNLQGIDLITITAALTNIVDNIWVGCSPITVGGNNCGSTQVVCNSPTSQVGLVNIGCLPVTA